MKCSPPPKLNSAPSSPIKKCDTPPSDGCTLALGGRGGGALTTYPHKFSPSPYFSLPWGCTCTHCTPGYAYALRTAPAVRPQHIKCLGVCPAVSGCGKRINKQRCSYMADCSDDTLESNVEYWHIYRMQTVVADETTAADCMETQF